MTEIQNTEKQKLHVETWGCQMNVADSERMTALMQQQKFELSNSAEDADLIVLNTCHIREKAKHKVVSRLGRLRNIKLKNPNLKIAVTGCVAQAEGKKLLEEVPLIDVLLGPGKIDKLPELVEKAKQEGKSQMMIGFEKPKASVETISEAESDIFDRQKHIQGKNEVSRFLNIQQGCNNFCTFCVVPFTRGREISDHPGVIVEKAKRLIESGAKEITLLGQNVNSYGLDLVERGELSPSSSGAFYDLLASVAEIPGLDRLRFTTSNPHDFTKPLADLFRLQPKLGKYIHLPVQSGSDIILKSMKRKVTVKEYWQRINWLRDAVPEIAISTDLIVGFPGETDDDFEGTYELVRELKYSFIFAFKYSPRKGTAAARFKTQVPMEVQNKRLQALNELQDGITLELNQQEVDSEHDVLFLYESKKDPGVYYGRNLKFQLVRVKAGRDIVGLTLPVRITNANKTALEGQLIH